MIEQRIIKKRNKKVNYDCSITLRMSSKQRDKLKNICKNKYQSKIRELIDKFIEENE